MPTSCRSGTRRRSPTPPAVALVRPGAPDTTVASDRGLSERDYIARLALLTQAALDGTPIDAAVEAFQRVPEPLPTREAVTA